MKFPALIFDFGNVVAHFDYTRAAEAIGRRVGLSGDAVWETMKPLVASPLVRQYESGRIAADTFSRGIAESAGLVIPHDEFASAWSDIFTLNEPVAGLIAELKGAGYTLVLGSNTNDLHADRFRRQFAEVLSHFDRMVLSFEVGHVKPSREFYLVCAEAAGAPPSACVFIDDLPENVEGARAAGLVPLLYRSPESLRDDLRAIGVSIPAGTGEPAASRDRGIPRRDLTLPAREEDSR